MRAARPLHVQVAADMPGIREVEAQAGDLFWELHGKTMDRLGYTRDAAAIRAIEEPGVSAAA